MPLHPNLSDLSASDLSPFSNMPFVRNQSNTSFTQTYSWIISDVNFLLRFLVKFLVKFLVRFFDKIFSNICDWSQLSKM